jgi:hypothetical protein
MIKAVVRRASTFARIVSTVARANSELITVSYSAVSLQEGLIEPVAALMHTGCAVSRVAVIGRRTASFTIFRVFAGAHHEITCCETVGHRCRPQDQR